MSLVFMQFLLCSYTFITHADYPGHIIVNMQLILLALFTALFTAFSKLSGIVFN